MRQGDPVSSFLSVIVINELSRMLKAITGAGFLYSFSVGSIDNGFINVSHLFADDTLQCCDMDPGHIQALKTLNSF